MATRPTPIMQAVMSGGDDAATGRLQPEHQAGQRDAAEQQAEAVEPAARRLPYVLDEQADQHDAEDADRHVDVEDPAPGELGNDKAANRRAEYRAEQRRHGEPGHRRHQFVFAAVRSSTRRPTGTIIAPPIPCRTRAATRNARLSARPHRTEPMVNTAIAARNTVRAP